MTTAVLDKELDLAPLGFASEFSNWVEDKGKYTCEALKNAAFIAAHLPRLFGYGKLGSVEEASKGINNVKTVMALPGAIKGAFKIAETLYADGLYKFMETIYNGGRTGRNLLGDVTYLIGDAIDSIKGLNAFKITAVSDNVLNVLAPVKDVCGVYGLSNSAYNLAVDIEKLREKELTIVDPKTQGNPVAEQYRKNYVEAKINNKWWDCMRDVCAVAMCSLGIIKWSFGMAVVSLGGPWPFVALSTAGVVGKALMHFRSQEANFWQTRLAEKMPTT